ncbi:methionine adenosyltransferase domain-containing protein (plasmid) [Escherichia coli]|uniref:methionine adenosyltransferase domain-containing protein n=1 Tax=Escherichia coli TaxID=562 RepID=UPI00202EE0FA|nr:methionine adenosyltransferase domain-containing protein [Escherichia coli]MCM1621456.1 methionine adenosyltransferase domain-containing protein [Escherichia coli]
MKFRFPTQSAWLNRPLSWWKLSVLRRPSEQLTLLVREFFDLRPYGLIQMLDLLHPIYKETAAYGHFGREHFPWEKTDKAQLLRDAAGLK